MRVGSSVPVVVGEVVRDVPVRDTVAVRVGVGGTERVGEGLSEAEKVRDVAVRETEGDTEGDEVTDAVGLLDDAVVDEEGEAVGDMVADLLVPVLLVLGVGVSLKDMVLVRIVTRRMMWLLESAT